jgi:hypothetical protein
MSGDINQPVRVHDLGQAVSRVFDTTFILNIDRAWPGVSDDNRLNNRSIWGLISTILSGNFAQSKFHQDSTGLNFRKAIILFPRVAARSTRDPLYLRIQ